MWGVSSPSAFNISAHTPSSPGALSFFEFLYFAFYYAQFDWARFCVKFLICLIYVWKYQGWVWSVVFSDAYFLVVKS